jgi:hypothetical protein
MGRAWVPPKVARELVAEREQFNAQMDERARQWQALETMREFNHELKRIDSLLELIFVPENADASGSPCRPGFWHVLRRNAGAPWTVIVIEDGDGMPVEPSSRLFEKLRQGDMWNHRSQRERDRMERKAQEAEDRRKVREREDREQEIEERVKAATRVQVSMNTSVPWTQNNSPVARRDAGEIARKRKAESAS